MFRLQQSASHMIFFRSSISHDDVPNDKKKTSVDQCSTVHCMGVRTYLFGEGYLTFHQRFRLSDKRSFTEDEHWGPYQPLISKRVSLTEMGFNKLKLYTNQCIVISWCVWYLPTCVCYSTMSHCRSLFMFYRCCLRLGWNFGNDFENELGAPMLGPELGRSRASSWTKSSIEPISRFPSRVSSPARATSRDEPSPKYVVNRAEPYWVGPRAVISRASSWAGPWATRDEPRAKSSEPSPRVSSRETSPSQAEQRSGAEASRAPSQAEPNPQPRAGKSGSSGSNQTCWRKIDLTVFAC